MSLITTISELRSILPRLFSNLSDTSNLPNIAKAQRKYLQPILGKALIDDLETKYQDNTLGDQEELVKFIQFPLAAYAVLDDLAFIHVMINDAGIFTTGTDKLTAAHRWEFIELKNTLQDYAIDGIEQLLAYLYDEKDELPLWTESDEFKTLDDCVIRSGTDFAKQYPLYSPLYTYWTLKPIMADVEENYLAPTFGRDLLTWIKQQDTIEIIIAGTGMVDVKKLVKKAVAFLTIKHACDHFIPRFDKNGFTTVHHGNPDDNSNTGFTAAAAQEVEQKKIICNRDGQNFLSKSAAFLVGLANGIYNSDFTDDFVTVFNGSPLKTDPNAKPWTNGNERRKIFTL